LSAIFLPEAVPQARQQKSVIDSPFAKIITGLGKITSALNKKTEGRQGVEKRARSAAGAVQEPFCSSKTSVSGKEKLLAKPPARASRWPL
jgi:hypothetical protein